MLDKLLSQFVEVKELTMVQSLRGIRTVGSFQVSRVCAILGHEFEESLTV